MSLSAQAGHACLHPPPTAALICSSSSEAGKMPEHNRPKYFKEQRMILVTDACFRVQLCNWKEIMCCTAKSQAWQAQRRLRSFPYCMKPHQKEEDAPKTETQRLSGSPSVSWKLLVWIPFTKRTQKWNSNFLEKPMGQLEMARQSSFILHFGKRNMTPKLNATKKK